MTLHIPNNHGEITFRWGLTGDPELMTSSIGFRANGTPTLGDMGAVIGDIGAAFETRWGLLTAAAGGTGWTYEGLDARYRHGGTLFDIQVYVTTTFTNALATPPNNCALLIKKNTGLAGRANRGRMYIPCFELNETGVDNRGLLTTAARSARQTVMDNFFNDVQTGTPDADLVVLHTEVSPGVGPTPTTITGFTVQSQLGTQRRRMRP